MRKRCECGTEMYFTVTKKGKRMPVDVSSLSDEDLERESSSDPLDQIPYREDHVSHFITCPIANKFRRGKHA